MIQDISFAEVVKHISNFESELQSNGYKSSTIKEFKININHFIRYSATKAKFFTFESIEEFMSIYDKKTRKSTYNFNRNCCIKFYYYVYYQDIYYKPEEHINIILSEEFDDILKRFIDYNNRNKLITIKRKHKTINDFLLHLEITGVDTIKKINCDIIHQYIEDKIIEERNYIKSFLSFLFINDYTSSDLSFFIYINRRATKIPTVYTQDEIERLIDHIDISTSNGIRDKALILLAASCGLRASDIANLKYENISFSTQELNITQVKTNQPLTVILSDELLDLLNKYNHENRPHSHSEYLFLNQYAPYNHISTSTIRYVVTKYFNKAGIDIKNKRHGPHSLRSSLATAMINSDISYEVVQKTLGHNSPKSLKNYVKVDIEKLREYSLASISPSGIFENWLEGDKE